MNAEEQETRDAARILLEQGSRYLLSLTADSCPYIATLARQYPLPHRTLSKNLVRQLARAAVEELQPSRLALARHVNVSPGTSGTVAGSSWGVL